MTGLVRRSVSSSSDVAAAKYDIPAPIPSLASNTVARSVALCRSNPHRPRTVRRHAEEDVLRCKARHKHGNLIEIEFPVPDRLAIMLEEGFSPCLPREASEFLRDNNSRQRAEIEFMAYDCVSGFVDRDHPSELPLHGMYRRKAFHDVVNGERRSRPPGCATSIS